MRIQYARTRAGLFLLGVLLSGAITGCGSAGSQKADEELFHNNALEEVGTIYVSHLGDVKKPPTKLAEFAKYEIGMPTGFNELRSGNIIAFLGASPSDAEVDKVLAYEKSVPEAGGFVLMGDGKTVKKLTADEFKSAPKAGTTTTDKAK